jgi:hypothetical protein
LQERNTHLSTSTTSATQSASESQWRAPLTTNTCPEIGGTLLRAATLNHIRSNPIRNFPPPCAPGQGRAVLCIHSQASCCTSSLKVAENSIVWRLRGASRNSSRSCRQKNSQHQ